jgi:hypothetical protein
MTEPLSESTREFLRQHFVVRVRRFVETFSTLDHENEFVEWISKAMSELKSLLQEDPDPICQDPERLIRLNELRLEEPTSLAAVRKWYGCFALRIYIPFIKAIENPSSYDAETFKKSLASRTQALEEKLDRYDAIETTAQTRESQSDAGRRGHIEMQGPRNLRDRHMCEIALSFKENNPAILRGALYSKVSHKYFTEYQKDDYEGIDSRAYKAFSVRVIQEVLRKFGI